MRNTPFDVKVFWLIRQLHFAPKRVKMTTIHLTLSYTRTKILRNNGYVLGVWNRQVANLMVEHYGNVTFWDGVVDIVFYSSTKMIYGTTTEVVN
jgi:hypothetical protein